jgi:trans-2,3-dihydro-3-hydroxyanthranilate isomerase
MDVPFVLADVFTRVPFRGNQLAVIPDARGLSAAAMQAITREFNFAESTFVLPPVDAAHAARVRIFTPGTELPFAGHPTVGTAAVLAHLGRAGAGEIVLEEGIGPVRVRIQKDEMGPTKATLIVHASVEAPVERPSATAAAAALGLPAGAIRDSWFAAIGPRFCFVHLDDPRSVDAAVLDQGAWKMAFSSAWAGNLFFFSGDTGPSGQLYARMFAPAFGIAEDPATGSAVAALAGTLAARAAGDGTFDWTVEQGVTMGRRSLLEASATKRGGGAMTIAVGGHVVINGQGTITVPPEVAGST